MAPYLFGASFGNQPPPRKHDDPVRIGKHDIHAVLGEQHRDPVTGRELRHEIHHLMPLAHTKHCPVLGLEVLGFDQPKQARLLDPAAGRWAAVCGGRGDRGARARLLRALLQGHGAGPGPLLPAREVAGVQAPGDGPERAAEVFGGRRS